MSRKIFIAASVVMTALFIFSAAARYMGYVEFRALELHEEGADRDRWVRLNDVCTSSSKAARFLFRFYPVFILLIWLTDRKYFGTAIRAALLSIALSALPWALLPSLTGGRADGAILMFYCRISFTETALVCLCVALTQALYRYIKHPPAE